MGCFSSVWTIVCRFLEIYLPMRQFFYNLIHPEYSAVTDVYVLMFLADTVDFIIIVFGFWAFGVGWFTGAEFFYLMDKIKMKTHVNNFLCVETLSGRHHLVAVGGSGAGTLSGYGPDPVWDHGGGPGSLPQKVCHGQGHLPGHPGLRHPLLDVLHPASGHEEVRTWSHLRLDTCSFQSKFVICPDQSVRSLKAQISGSQSSLSLKYFLYFFSLTSSVFFLRNL